jgi:hypothetical protein
VLPARTGRWPPLLVDAAALACAVAVLIGVALDTPALASAPQPDAMPGVTAAR